MALAGAAGHLLAEQVLEQVLARVEVRQARIQQRELLRDRVDVVEMLDRPLAELGTRELAGGPGAAERVAATMLGLTGRFQRREEFLLGHQLGHRFSPCCGTCAASLNSV